MNTHGEAAATYRDGRPFDRVRYLEAKLILKPDRFTSVAAFHYFGKLVRRTARALDVGYTDGDVGPRPRIREIVFGDTPDMRLYRHAFILRRRTTYVDGFAVGDPEIVFKFRHADARRSAAVDVRPNIEGSYRIKFKAEVRMPWWLVLIFVVAGIIVIAFPILMLKTVTYRISNYRIDYERGVLSKNIDTLELWHVEDVRLHQSLLDRILGCGTITVVSKDETTPHLDLLGLPNPRPIFENLKQRIIAVKRQRGVIKMDVG